VSGTFVELLRERAAGRHAEKGFAFLRDGEHDIERMSYAELDRRARALAGPLRERAAAGERVLLVFEAGLDYIAALFGCLYAGAIAVPLYPPDPLRPVQGLEHLARVAAVATARFAMTSADLWPRLTALARDLPALAGLQWLDTASDDLATADDWREPPVSSATPAILQYTSGSTAAPRGVVVSHANLLANACFIREAFDLSETSRGVSWLPPHHDMGLMGGILEPLFLGAETALLSPQSFLQRPARFLEAITAFGGTTCGGPSFAYELLTRRVSAAAKARLDLASWSVAFCGAEPVRAETLEAFAEAFAPCGFRREAFLPCYGLAEATLFVAGAAPHSGASSLRLDAAALEAGQALLARGPAPARTVVSCGRPPSGVSLRIVHPESAAPLPDGQVGEIWVRSPAVASGYWGDEAASRQVFGAGVASEGDGDHLRSGDLGFVLDGELYVTGRIKDLIVVRGRNLYPADLEHTLERAHPSVRRGRTVAFSVPVFDEERLVVAFEVRPTSKQDASHIAETLRRHVSAVHGVLPHAVVMVEPDALPRTSSGKPQRPRCRALFLDGRLGRLLPALDATTEAQAAP
jgi:acyl-CoA synthetase (AMP-forming)/AMP-acid ligase II